MKKRYVAAGAVIAIAGMTGCSSKVPAAPGNAVIQVEPQQDHVVRVSASETTEVVPDIAEFVFAVQTMEADAQACQEKNKEAVSKVITALTDSGLDAESIQTSDFGLYPRYDWSENVQEIIGYEMTTEITVSDVPVDQAGEILGKSVEAGVNQIQSVAYHSSRYEEEYHETLKKAAAAAREKAEAMAEAGGFQLGSVINMEEQSSDQQTWYTNYKLEVSDGMTADTASVMPGEVDVEAKVYVEFDILE